MFLEISQNPLENTRARVPFFNKVAGLWVLPYIKNIFEETNQINKNNISKHERNGLMELKTMKIS